MTTRSPVLMSGFEYGPQVAGWLPVARTNAGLRIGDAERDRAVADLGEHFAAGRLDQGELEDRVEQAMQARFAGDLTPLLADLPQSTPPPAREFRPARPPAMLWFLPMLLMAAVVTAVLVDAPWLIWIGLWFVMFGRFAGPRRRPGRLPYAQPGQRASTHPGQPWA